MTVKCSIDRDIGRAIFSIFSDRIRIIDSEPAEAYFMYCAYPVLLLGLRSWDSLGAV